YFVIRTLPTCRAGRRSAHQGRAATLSVPGRSGQRPSPRVGDGEQLVTYPTVTWPVAITPPSEHWPTGPASSGWRTRAADALPESWTRSRRGTATVVQRRRPAAQSSI